MTAPPGNSGADDIQPLIAPLNNLSLNLSTSPQGGVSLFDILLHNGNKDDLSVVNKSVVDVSSKNVLEAKALANEMQSQLAASLAELNQSKLQSRYQPQRAPVENYKH